MRFPLILVGMLGCAASAKPPVPASPARFAEYRAKVAGSEELAMRLHGHVREPIVCTVALDIASWYGSSDEDGPWQLTGAEESLDGAVMMPAKGTMNLRDELERFGVRDCVLDVQPAAR